MSESADLGPFCSKLRIAKPTFLKDLEKTDPAKLKNGHVFQIGKNVQDVTIPWKAVLQSLGKAYD